MIAIEEWNNHVTSDPLIENANTSPNKGATDR